jgi:hypothetical protein
MNYVCIFKNLPISIFFLGVLTLLSGCYTVLKQSPQKNTTYTVKPKLPPNTEDTSELAGVWIHKRLWMDYGYEYNRIEIYENGKLVYIPSSERSNSEIFYGSYYISTDTMSVLFENIGLEQLKYSLNADTLLLETINPFGGIHESLINDCYSCIIRWIRSR